MDALCIPDHYRVSCSMAIFRFVKMQHSSTKREKRESATKLIFSWVSAALDLLSDLFFLLPQMTLSSLVVFILFSCFLRLLFLFVPVRPPLSSL